MDVIEWKKSSYCHSANCCVEVAVGSDEVLVRDTNNEVLRFTFNEWQSFIDEIKASEHD